MAKKFIHKVFATLTAFCISCTGVFAAVESNTAVFNEQQQNVVEISSASELEVFRDAVNNGEYAGVNAKLTADITLSGEWTPIGNAQNPFDGHFDGQGHSISGLEITKFNTYIGLFGNMKQGSIKNVELVEPKVHITDVVPTSQTGIEVYFGCLLGRGIVSGSSNTIALNNITINGGGIEVDSQGEQFIYAGGVAGRIEAEKYAKLDVSNCASSMDIDIKMLNKGAHAGLVIGEYRLSRDNSVITNCVAQGNVSVYAKNSANSGLVVGYCVANGPYAGVFSQEQSAALSGIDDYVIIKNCIASGKAYTNASLDSCAGYIVGQFNAYSVAENVYYTSTSVCTAVKQSGSGRVTSAGTCVDTSTLKSAEFLKNTLQFDIENVWKVHPSLLPRLLVHEPAAGDYNENGSVDLFDAIRIAQAILNENFDGLTDDQISASDVNNDGKIDTPDAVTVSQILAKL